VGWNAWRPPGTLSLYCHGEYTEIMHVAVDFEAAVRKQTMNPLIIWVPSPLGLRPSGLENAPDALRRAGLHECLGSSDVVRIDVPPYCDVCDPGTAILNPQGIAKVAREVAGAMDAALGGDRVGIQASGWD
jgi:hypothetical protein